MLFFDDAYITFRYARNLVENAGFVYNTDQHVLGTTTPLYTLLLAGFGLLTGADFIPQISFWLANVADSASVVIFYRLAKYVFQHKYVSILAASIFLFHPLRLNVTAGGMETSIFILFIFMMYYHYFQGRRFGKIALWAAMALLTRPDAFLAFLPLFVFWLYKEPLTAVKAACLTFILCLPWIVWAVFYFGSPLPHSLTAKHSTYGSLPPGSAFFYLLTFFSTGSIGPYDSPAYLLPGLASILPLACLGLVKLWKKRPEGLAIAGYPLLYAAVMTILNPAMFFSWYYPPLMPGWILLVNAGIWFSVQNRLLRKILLAALALMMTVAPALLMALKPGFPLSRVREQAFFEACGILEGIDQPGEIVLAPDIGVIGWCLEDSQILDSVGLISPEALPYLNETVSQGIMSLEMVKDKNPDTIVSLDQFIRHIYDAPAFKSKYRVLWQDVVSGPGYAPQTLWVFRREY